ncbi:IS1380 family transposase [Streptomyces cellulosae]|uniref:IS1380 family transposase n=1 Tax=Streptomyces cellulosae TaxID=1968 RepID=UPI0004CC1487|nr:IS1380 family transposase [Streptomyces cellulosae]
MKKRIGFYPRVRAEGGGRGVVSQAGAVLLVETARKTGLDAAMSAALEPWRKPRAVHDPGKILLDVALALALGGDGLADVALLRAEPAVFGPVASDPTVSRLVGQLASGGKRVLAALRTARAEVREHVWRLAGDAAPDAGGQVIVDIDGVLVLAHSEKQDAAATWKKTFGHHPLMGFVDHGRGGSGEPVVCLLRPGNAGSNTAADHIEATKLALAQLPKRLRRGRQTLIRTDSGGGTHEFVAWLARRGRWLSYSVGMTITDAVHQAVLKVPASAWTPAVEPDGDIRDGAWGDTAQNQIWLEIVQIALDLLAWMPLLALTGQARLWEPRRLRLRLFSTAAQLVTTGRRRYLRLARHWPWTDVITDALDRLQALPNPG